MKFPVASFDQPWMTYGLISALALGVACLPHSVQAQIVPDNTLPINSSVVPGCTDCLINGGTNVGSTLYHSFGQFSVPTGGAARFNNAATIQNILTRVTGATLSNIDGLIQVNGSANLFLLNPHGIVFGPNAQLDIAGSFVATTADRMRFSDGSEFSATNPQAPPLLNVTVPLGLQYGASPTGATIVNRGNLAVGQDLTFIADRLKIQGTLQAGRNLTLQGQQSLDLFSLLPSGTPAFRSGGGLTLQSDGAIAVDAHFASGSNFVIQSISGSLPTVTSQADPIISAVGHVDIAANYSGPSLLVEATGNIRFQGTVNITTPDLSGTLPPGPDTNSLTNSTALILRSGQSTLQYNGINSGAPAYADVAIPAGVTLGGTVTLDPYLGKGGLVSITTATGDVSGQAIFTRGGRIEVTSAGAIAFQGDLNTTNNGLDAGDITLTAAKGAITTGQLDASAIAADATGKGGRITVTAQDGGINTGPIKAFTLAYASGQAGDAGAIVLSATNGDITAAADPVPNPDERSSLNTHSLGAGNTGRGGDVTVTIRNGNLKLPGHIDTSTLSYGNGTANQAGKMTLDVQGGNITANRLFSLSLSTQQSAGTGGEIAIAVPDGNLTVNQLQSFSLSANNGDASNGGVISVKAGGDITVEKSVDSFSLGQRTSGNGGPIQLDTRGSIKTGGIVSFSLTTGAAGTGDSGNGGPISLKSTEGTITADELVAFSISSTRNSGQGGAIAVQTIDKPITLGKLESFSTGPNMAGPGGAITLQVRNSPLTTKDIASFSSSTTGNSSQGGPVKISIANGDLKVGNIQAMATSINALAGNGGPIAVDVQQGTLETGNLYSFSGSITSNTGLGGDITLNARNGQLKTGDIASFSTSVTGEPGRAGTVILNTSQDFTPRLIVATGGQKSGDIRIKTDGMLFVDNTVLSSDTFGAGEGGNIKIEAASIVITKGGQISSSTHGAGQGGTVEIATKGTIEIRGSTVNEPPKGVIASAGLTGIEAGTYLGGYIPTGDARFLTAPGIQYFSGIFTQATKDSSGNAGNIKIATNGLLIEDQAAIATTTFGRGSGGNIAIRNTGATTIRNGSILSGVAEGSGGNSGTIDLQSQSLLLDQGGLIRTQTLAPGSAGKIQVAVAETLRLVGANTGFRSGTEGNSGGRGGDMTIQAQTLELTAGASIDAQTRNRSQGGSIAVTAQTATLDQEGRLLTTTSGSGPAGNITLQVAGTTLLTGAGSGLFANTTAESSGPGGNITVRTDTLRVSDRAELNATTAGSGAGGSVNVIARLVDLERGGQLLTTTSGSGPAGDIVLAIADRLFLDGAGTGLFASTLPNSTGTGGSILVDPPTVLIQNNAGISVDSQGKGNGGNLRLEAETLTLDRNAFLTAATASGEGGNITLQVSDLVLMRRQSLISATAGGTGNGGNVTINAQFVVANPFENSDIVANAIRGRGGKIQITTQGLLGLEYRPRQTPLSDITASSEFGASGVININTPGIDPSRGLVTLPTNLTDSANQIVQSCAAGPAIARRQSQFVVTGRGGLPLSPEELLDPGQVLTSLTPLSGNSNQANGPSAVLAKVPEQITEAQGWRMTPDGTIVLVAQAETVLPKNWQQSSPCPGGQL